jgi:MFS transporter, AAHS family, benzoate transport protein
MMAFGRFGGIVYPILVGMLMSLNPAVQLNFMVIAIAGVLGTLAIAFVQEKHAYYNTVEKISDTAKVI